MLVLIALSGAESLVGQEILAQPERVIRIARGGSVLLTRPTVLERVSIADEAVADAVPITSREILINGKEVGSTSLLVWAQGDIVRMFRIEVTADIAALQRQLQTLFPDQDLSVEISGNALILSGTVRDPSIVRRALELAETTGVTVINNIQAPSPEQILLHVRFAEVARSFLRRFGSDLFFLNPQRLDQAFDRDDQVEIETLSEGLVRFLVLGDNTGIEGVIRALRSSGEFRSLAEPNVIALEGQTATFLAGGEFPYPSVQAGTAGGVGTQPITIQFKEFGIRLNFTPTVTRAGTIRLRVAPEVSTLDFANGLTLQGFEIPALITRRVETEVELRAGQHLAIAGLLDNSIAETLDKLPLLGDIPILGSFFRSSSNRQDRTELLVLVTPHFIQPADQPPEVPTGEPETWNWDGRMRAPLRPAGQNR